MANKTYTYVSDYATVIFTVPGEDEWTEDAWDAAGLADLKSYVTEPDSYWLDNVEDN